MVRSSILCSVALCYSPSEVVGEFSARVEADNVLRVISFVFVPVASALDGKFMRADVEGMNVGYVDVFSITSMHKICSMTSNPM